MTEPLKITPKELEFKVLKDETVISGFKIENTSKEMVTFKVKTTAPKRYTVRPNVGIMNPGDSSPIKVTCNPSKDPKKESEPDKFLIQSIIISMNPGDKKPPKPEDTNFSDYIRNIWSSPASTIYKERIKIILKKSEENPRNSAVLTNKDSVTLSSLFRNNISRNTSRSGSRMETMSPRNSDIINSRIIENSRNPESKRENPPNQNSFSADLLIRNNSRSSERKEDSRPGISLSRSPSGILRDNFLSENTRTPPEREMPSRDNSRNSRNTSVNSQDYYRSPSRGSSIDTRDRSESRETYENRSYRENSRTNIEMEERGRSGYNRSRRVKDSSSEDDQFRSASVSRSTSPLSTLRMRENESDYRRPDRAMNEKTTTTRKAPSEFEFKEKLFQAERQKMMAFLLVAFLAGILFSKWFLT